mgnify:CR=1 FL=1
MSKIKILIFLTLIFFSNNITAFGLENKILVKIENQIITSLDVNNEYKYLIALNPNIKNSKKEDLIKLSKRSIIQEKIKKIAIEKNFNNPKIPQKYLEQILKNVYSRIGINNLNDFKKYLEINNIDFENVQKKLKIEALWNELILIKFSSKIKIDEENLKNKIQKDNNKFLKSYLLSEISFEISNLNDLDKKFIEISEIIKNKGFDFAALKYSLSPTSNLGGRLDWINENSLNKNILFSQSIHGFEMGRGRISGLSTHKDLMLIGLGTALDLFVLSLMTEVVEKDPGLFSYKMPEYGTICPHHAVPLHYNRINLNVVEMPRVSSSGDIAFMGEGDYDSFKDLKSIIIRDDELIHGLIELFPGQDIFDIIFSTVDKSS